MAKGYLSEIFTSIQGEGPYLGLRQIFVRFTGCSLHCDFCDTKSAWEKTSHLKIINSEKYELEARYTNPITTEDTLSIIRKIINCESKFHSVFLTGGEPLEQAEYFQELAKGLKRSGLTVYLETNTINFEALEEIIASIDIISADVKILHPDFEKIHSKSLWKFLTIPTKNVLFLKIPVNSSLNLTLFYDTIKKISSIRHNVPIIIQPLTEELLPVPDQDFIKLLLDLQRFASDHFYEVRIIPQIHKFLKIK